MRIQELTSMRIQKLTSMRIQELTSCQQFTEFPDKFKLIKFIPMVINVSKN